MASGPIELGDGFDPSIIQSFANSIPNVLSESAAQTVKVEGRPAFFYSFPIDSISKIFELTTISLGILS